MSVLEAWGCAPHCQNGTESQKGNNSVRGLKHSAVGAAVFMGGAHSSGADWGRWSRGQRGGWGSATLIVGAASFFNQAHPDRRPSSMPR